MWFCIDAHGSPSVFSEDDGRFAKVSRMVWSFCRGECMSVVLSDQQEQHRLRIGITDSLGGSVQVFCAYGLQNYGIFMGAVEHLQLPSLFFKTAQFPTI